MSEQLALNTETSKLKRPVKLEYADGTKKQYVPAHTYGVAIEITIEK